MLSHISIERVNKIKKAYFIGYMIYPWYNCSLGRAFGDERDHYGKKRLDMSGVLLSSIFRQLIYVDVLWIKYLEKKKKK